MFYVCPGAYGEGTITRMGSPSLQAFLEDLSQGDGAFSTKTAGTSGFRELAYVFPNQRGQNAHPPHPDHPGHFTCDDGSVYVPAQSNTLGVTAFDLSSRSSAGRTTVSGQVTVKNELGQALPNVTVGVLWTRPDGTSEEQFETTDRNGVAKFSVAGTRGVYNAVISELDLRDYAYSARSIWTATITAQ